MSHQKLIVRTPWLLLIATGLLSQGIFSTLFAQGEPFTMSQLGQDYSLNTAWELTYGPDDFLWITERSIGRVVRVDPSNGNQDVLLTLPDVYSDSGQNGLLGMALHPGLGAGQNFVYLSYTYLDQGDRRQKIVRYTYSVSGNNGTLGNPEELLVGLPASNDHNSGRIRYGPDGKLYYTIGDQGANQFGNKCTPILSQVLPTQAEVDAEDWSAYPGSILRLNPDGSIPGDNPVLDGVRSHIFTYGHRNAQGLIFGNNERLYSNEHGPKSDDEVNLIVAGGNYGWPYVAGFQDDMAYTYCNWSSASNCGSIGYSNYSCPGTATETAESSWSDPFVSPLMTLFTVENGYDFTDPNCTSPFICWPTVAPSSLKIYERNAIPGWNNSLLIVSLKKGKVYRVKLNALGNSITTDTMGLWYTQNRYRDVAIAPDGQTFYVITDGSGQTSGPSGSNTSVLVNPGTILKFTYDPASLPVSYLHFNGEAEGKVHRLRWETLEEVDNRGFTVERSSDEGEWSALDFVEGRGNPGGSYSFDDRDPLPGNNYYRLAQHDFDETINYSRTIRLEGFPATEVGLIVYPNPTHEGVTLAPQKALGALTIKVFDLSGEQLGEEHFPDGAPQPSISLEALPAGIYLLEVLTARERYVRRVVKR